MKAKVCLVGDAAVGKTSLIRRFVHDAFSDAYVSTLGAKVLAKDVTVPVPQEHDVDVRMAIWDIIGETSLMEDLGETFFSGVQGVVAVCDLTRYSTFERLPLWIDAVKKTAGDVPVALAVNKTDMREQVIVLYEESRIQDFAERWNARWRYTSAKTGTNVESLFFGLAEDMVRRLTAAQPHPV